MEDQEDLYNVYLNEDDSIAYLFWSPADYDYLLRAKDLWEPPTSEELDEIEEMDFIFVTRDFIPVYDGGGNLTRKDAELYEIPDLEQ